MPKTQVLGVMALKAVVLGRGSVSTSLGQFLHLLKVLLDPKAQH